jgi:phage shock protein A
MFRCFRKRVSLETAVRNMQHVECLFRDMIVKYEKIREETRLQLHKTHKKSRKLIHLKKIKTLDYHITQCENKIAACMQKQHALEQLELTRLQVEAIRQSTSVFKQFSKYNPIDKIEDLQETMEELTEDLADVTGLLSSSSVEFDDDELMQELRQMETDEEMVEELPEVPRELPVQPIQFLEIMAV